MGGSATTSIARNSTSDSQTNHPLQDFARDHNATPNQIALAWLIQRSPVILPIPGTASIPHLEANVAAASLNIPEADWDTLELIAETLAS
jgi:aryl-alcohol dehydrogenase-like predicted oxidoreductase